MLCISTMHQFGFWNSDPISGCASPCMQELDGVRYKGSDFIWAAFARAARTHPEWFSPRRMAEEPGCCDRFVRRTMGIAPLPEVERYQALYQAHGRALYEQWPGGYTELLADCNAHPQPVRQLLRHLRLLPGRADPMAKKANLLAIIWVIDPKGLRLRRPRTHPADCRLSPDAGLFAYRLCGVVGSRSGPSKCLRTWVDAVEEQAIRAASMEAIDSLVRLGGIGSRCRWVFLFLGSSALLGNRVTALQRMPIETVCGRNVERFQPIFRTSFY